MRRLSENPTEASDEMLMVRYQRGDRDAFAALVNRHAAAVFSIAFYLLGDTVAAEYVARETFQQLASDAATFHMEAQFRTWLFAKVHRIVRNHDTQAQPDQQADSEWPPSSPKLDALPPEPVSPSSTRGYRSQLLLRRLTARVASLPLDMREAFLFKQLGQLSIVSVADAMCIDPDTVRQLIRSAFDRLQEGVTDTEEYARALR
jgi:RNA polymerase sigma-70 factor (ECF subfamily)